MMRSLWTAASGMTAQQVQVDVISNNLANVNTTGYKQETVNFKSLLYQNLETAEQQAAREEEGRPTVLQVGHGTRVGSIGRDFTTGSWYATGNDTDMTINGNGYFAISDGYEVTYTKDGTFRWSNTEEGLALVTAAEHPVLSVEGESIIVPEGVPVSSINVDSTGRIFHYDDDGNPVDLAQIQLVQFANQDGLEAIGANKYRPTTASGEPLMEVENDELSKSKIITGYLEGSNVNIATEMVNLIVAQRAYEMNSTAIKTSDEMLQQANQLKRT
ncbi:MAG: hypothetical protein ATN33_02350 [Epulopiscium sp. Nele67-Bin001]|nr:MAG: hypothetical protein BEN18_00475 [Epulopiscium sp. Nuni2H_MBin001]OON90747.1 MAG: hypothetical protein ATN33_02350 [Epulopiscium sp. Nele67-Bin001]